MNQQAVEHVLLSQLADAHRPDFFRYRTLSRRAFLVGGSLLAAPAAAARIGADTPRFVWVGNALRVSIGGASWLIDPDAFAGTPRLALERRPSDYLIMLGGARFAGTAVRADLHARIYRGTREWRIALAAPRLTIEGDMPLGEWLEGREVSRHARPRRLTVGGERLSLSAGEHALSSRGGLTLTMRAGSVSLAGTARCRGNALILTCRGPRDENVSLARLAGMRVRQATRFEIVNPQPGRQSGFALGQHGEYRPSHMTSVAGEAFEGPAGRDAALLVEGGGALIGSYATGRWGKHLELGRSALFLANRGGSIVGTPAGGQRVHEGAVSARLATEGHEPVVAHFPASGAATVKGKLKLDSIWLPFADGTRATVDFAAAPASVALATGGTAPSPLTQLPDAGVAAPPGEGPARAGASGEAEPAAVAAAPLRFNRVLDLPRTSEHLYDPTPGENAEPRRKDDDAAGPADAEIVVTAAGIALDEARVILRRDSDLLNLEFRLIGFDLRISQGRPYLRRTAAAELCRIIVEFQPQHIWETVYPKPAGCAAPATGLAAARLSRRSRLAFKPRGDAWRRRSLDVADLTDWTDLELVVDKRAAGGLGERIEEQLRLPGILADDPALDLFQKVAGSFTPPDSKTTALELASRLTFSPAEKLVNEDKSEVEIRWQQQSAGTKARGEPLWNVRLDEAGRKSVRAIWSSYLQGGRFYRKTRTEEQSETDQGRALPLALTPIQHWEIVAQTSLYGLPALRRLEPEGKRGDPVVTALKKIPRGGVIRPPGDPEYLRQIDGWQGYTNKDTGIALATPFDDADISLTALGGIFRARWEGEPAQLRPDITRPQVPDNVKGIAPTGFSLEQLTYQSWLGRDIRVVAVTKGYLFPLGVRAAFVEIAERRFYPDPAANGAPVSFEVRRQFIRCRPDPKTFPALNQPYRSRDFPAQSITMRTLITPDLIEPDTVIGSELQRLHTAHPQPGVPPAPLPIDPDRRLFWPKVAGGDGSDFQFQWTTDSEASASSPLIFVESAYAGLERVMELLAKHYYPKQPALRRTARFFGVRQRYAPDDEKGDTSFDTDNWLLEARGQIFGDEGNSESFVIDGRMQGADQPPFYPVVTRAQVTIQSLDRLLGAPQGLISVAFYDKYRTLGFGDPKHPSDIYLKVLGPRIALDVTDRSQTSGGLASPSALVAAISRQTGIVGGKEIGTTGAGGTQKLLASDHEGGFEFEQAALGKFDPVEFFGFKDAKLLGILDLKTVIKGALSLSSAPQLIETVSYGALKDLGGLERVKKAARTAEEVTTKFFALFDDLAARVSAPLTLKDLYPDLVLAAEKARADLRQRFASIQNAARIEDIGAHAMAIMAAAKPLLREIDRLARDPIPQVATEIVTQFTIYWKDVGKALDDEWKTIADTLLRRMAGELGDAVCAVIDAPGNLEGAFFGASTTVTCKDFLAKPDDLVANSGRALFREAFALPLSRLLTAAGDMQDVSRQSFALPQDAIRAQAQALLDKAHEVIKHRLAPFDATRRDIRDAAVRIATARAIVAALADKLERDFVPPRIDGITDRFIAGLDDELRRQIGVLKDAIHPVIPPDPEPPETAGQILADVEAQLLHPLRDAAIAAVKDEAAKIERLIREQAYALERQLMARIGTIVSDAFAELLATAEFARIAALRSVNGLCDNVYTAGRTLSVGVIATMSVFDQALVKYRSDLVALDFGTLPAGTADRAEAIRSELLQLLATLGSDMADLKDLIATVPAPGKGCAEMPALLDPARQVLLARHAMLQRIAALADALARLRQLLGAALKAEVQSLAKQLAKLLGDITSIGKLETTGVAAVDRVIALLNAGEPYRLELERQLGAMRTAAGALRKAINDPGLDALVLPRLAADVQGYSESFDRAVAALVMQSAALTGAAVAQWQKGVAAAIRAAAGVVSVLHRLLRKAFDTLLAELEKPAMKPFVEFVLGIAAFDRLKETIGAIAEEDDLLARIAKPQTSDSEVIREAGALHAKWKAGEPAVASAVAIISGFIEDFLSGNLGDSLAAKIRDALKAYARELRDMLGQFVPTKIETGYDWGATINPGAVFKMSERAPDPTIQDLALTVKASVDIVSGRRSLTTTGTLQAFELMLLPGAHMATIKFGALSFESRNGSSPDFNVDVVGVEIGPMLKFLEPLRAFMEPQGNGFYLTPTFAPMGIEAGFQFGSALIQVGSLSFQNVFIRVAAWLPFGRDPAKFIFGFASEDRPFLISSPPYGGGGYVLLTAEPGGRTDLELSFVFGGVSAIKFGPLRAQGRIVAGIGVRTAGDGTTLWAIFEAFGEGSIACFSVTVSLRVTVWHYANGEMVGQTNYSFAFKLGFLKYRYSVTARYQLKSGSGAKRAAARGPGDAIARAPAAASAKALPAQSYQVRAPRKERDWAGYRRNIDSSFL
jgi:HAMP domain-containing protein